MSPVDFYKTQAIQQQEAADQAQLENVRDRCQRAADAWTVLAVRGERVANGRSQPAALDAETVDAMTAAPGDRERQS